MRISQRAPSDERCANGMTLLALALALALSHGCSGEDPLQFLELTIDPEVARAGSLLSIELLASREAPRDPSVTVSEEAALAVGFTRKNDGTMLYLFNYEVTGEEQEGSVLVKAFARDEQGAEVTLSRMVSFAFTNVEMIFPRRTWPDNPLVLEVEIFGSAFEVGHKVIWDASGTAIELQPTVVESNRLEVILPADLRSGGPREVQIVLERESGSRSEPVSFILGGVLPDTGQTTCHGEDAAFTTCPTEGDFSGQDAQSGWDLHFDPGLEPGVRFTTHGSEAILLDRMTLLRWQRCVNGQSGFDCSVGSASPMTWQEAIEYCDGLELGGQSWRLPTIEELSTIVNAENTRPSANTSVFPQTPSFDPLWSSSISHSFSGYAWSIDFLFGYVAIAMTFEEGYARCVHGGDEFVSAPLRRSIEAGQPVVRDLDSGVMWQGCSAGQEGNECQGDPFLADWKHSLAYCRGLSWGGHEDWRLPDRNELQSIVDYDRSEPATDAVAFPGIPDEHWSSTSHAGGSSKAWFVRFANGPFFYADKETLRHVRCVRKGLSP